MTKITKSAMGGGWVDGCHNKVQDFCFLFQTYVVLVTSCFNPNHALSLNLTKMFQCVNLLCFVFIILTLTTMPQHIKNSLLSELGGGVGPYKLISMVLITDKQALNGLITSELGGLSPDDIWLVGVSKGKKSLTQK